MDSIKSKARHAGVLYLLILIMAPIPLIYVPSLFIVAGNATATARNITNAVADDVNSVTIATERLLLGPSMPLSFATSRVRHCGWLIQRSRGVSTCL